MDMDGNGVLDPSEFQSMCSDFGMDDDTIHHLFVAFDTKCAYRSFTSSEVSDRLCWL